MLTVEHFNEQVTKILELTKKIDERLKKDFNGQVYRSGIETQVDQVVRMLLTEGLRDGVLLEMPVYKTYMNETGGYAIIIDQRSMLGIALNAWSKLPYKGMTMAERDDLESRCKRFP